MDKLKRYNDLTKEEVKEYIEEAVELNTRKINCKWTKWIAVVFGATGIGLYIFDCSLNGGTLLKVLEAIATVLSITLSVFAILMTRDANNAASRQFDRLSMAENKIQESAIEISKTSQGMVREITQIHAHLQELNREQGKINGFLFRTKDIGSENDNSSDLKTNQTNSISPAPQQ